LFVYVSAFTVPKPQSSGSSQFAGTFSSSKHQAIIMEQTASAFRTAKSYLGSYLLV